MKKITILFILSSIFISCVNTSSKNGQRFKTSTTKVYSTTDSFGEIQKTLETTIVVICNDKGDTISEQSFPVEGESKEYIRTYDEKGRLIEWREKQSNGEVNVFYSVLYDQNDNIIGRTQYPYSDYTDSLVYDELGNMISCATYKDNNIVSKVVNNYDGSNRLITEAMYDQFGSLVYRKTYSYDSRGNQKQMIHYNSDGKLTRKTDFIYDEHNNITSSDETTYDYEYLELFGSPNESHSIHHYYYDSHNNLLRHYCETGVGTPVYEYVYSYDNKNLIRSEERVFVSGIESQTITTYDVFGNELDYSRYNTDGSRSFHRVTKYNDRNLPICFEFYESAETLTQLVEITYEY